MTEYMPVLATCLACLFSLATGLVCWALKTEIQSLQIKFQLALKEAEQRFYDKVDKIYVRKDSFRPSPSKARPRRLKSGPRKLNGKH